MEKFSEKKRGRPKVLDGENEKVMESVYYDAKSRRSLLNKHYSLIAFRILTSDQKVLPGYEYLFGGNDLNNANPKETILTELGRLKDPELIRVFAQKICEDKMKTKQAVQQIRDYRLDRVGVKPDGDKLTSALIKTINDFFLTYPATTYEQCKDSLALAQILITTLKRTKK